MHRLLFAGDLHKRPKDITTIEGYVDCCIAVQQSLCKVIQEKNCNYFFSLGDWYDRGYASDLAASHADEDADIEMSKMLKGNFYGVIGNHIRLHMDSNPELHMIQPHPTLKSRRKVTRTEQIIKTPDYVRVGDVQISLMHHRKDVDDVLAYKPTRRAWATYHIALFHTPSIVPNAQLVNTKYSYNASSNSKIGNVVEDVDLAICGDIHNALGQFTVKHEKGSTIMIVPGSLTNTDSSVDGRHSSIMLPYIEIDDESHVKLQYIHFDLQLNRLSFKKGNIENTRERLKSVRGKNVSELHKMEDTVSVIGRCTAASSLNAFMLSQHYTEKDKKIVRHILNQPEDLEGLTHIYRNVGEISLL